MTVILIDAGASRMVDLDIYPFVPWSDFLEALGPEERERRRLALAAERDAKAQAVRKRARSLRKNDLDHLARVGVRGSAGRAGMMRPTAEREQHGEVVIEDRTVIDDGGHVVRARGPRIVNQTPLDRYLSRRSIDERQHKAGERLRSDWYTAGLEPHTTANLLGSGGGGECAYGMARNEAQAIARESYRSALKALGIRLAPVLVVVCCEDRSATDWALSKGVRDAGPPRGRSTSAEIEGLAALRIALDMLADHYGY